MPKTCRTEISFLLSILLIVCAFATVRAQDPNANGMTADRGFHPTGSYALSNIESINLVGGNLNYSIPLAALPPSRGGRLKPAVYLLYNSKLYDTQVRMCLGPSCTFKYTQTDVIKAFRGGWTFGTSYFVLTQNRATNYVDGATPPHNTYKYKTEIFFPDGSSHQLRPVGQAHNDDYYPVAPGIGGTTTYYSTDSTYFRAQFSVDGLSWTLYFSDGSTVNHNNSTGVQTTTDGNGNSYTVQNITLPNGNPATQVIDQLNRKITIEKPVSGPHYVRVNGVGGTELVTTINWTTTSSQGKKYLWKVFHEDDIYTFKTSVGTHTVVSSINLPNGLSYQFQYNSQIFDPLNPTKSVGWGELYQATLPTGAKARYAYNMDNRHGNQTDDILEPTLILWNHPASKQLEYTERHDLVDTLKIDTWTYSLNIAESGPAAGQTSSAAIFGPDGSATSEFFEVNSSGNPSFGLDGLSYKTIRPDGSKIERVWLENMPSGGNGRRKNPYVKTQFTSIPDAGGALVKTAITDNVYDKNGNVVQRAEYDWVAYGDVQRDANGRPTGAIPGSAQLKRVSVSNVYNQTPTADSGGSSPHTYKETTAPNLRNALAWSEVRSNFSDASAKSRSEFYYDDPNGKGNLTSQRNWDSTKGALARPLAAGTYISVSHVYDVNGNRTDATDAKGVRTQFVFGTINGFTNLYPTEIRVAVDFPALKRTSTQEYDFWTGLGTRATDVDNNVSTATTFDVFGRPTLVKAAEGKPEETRTVTQYSDTLRRVIVRSDLDMSGDGKLVSIHHYDQLGRLCLRRQLEDSANQSEIDETHGIKVQTRYRFTSTNSYTLTSNPYRAATSGAAGGEGTMGWTRSKADRVGRVIEAQTFGGTSLPDPWGTNTTSIGIVTTSYNANAITVADQAQPAGKSRRSVTDGVGRLTEVYEDPLGANYQTAYTYDALNNLLTVTQGTQTRTFNYSSLSRLTSANYPESGTVSYQYDNNGNIYQKTDARSVVSTYVHDWLDRNITIDYSNTASINPDITRVYDTATNGKGQLAESYAGGTESSTGNVEHTKIVSYDALGRPLDQRQRFKTSGVWSAEFQTQRSYNRVSAVTSQTYPSGRTVSYGYDPAGRLQAFSGTLGDGVNRNYSSGILYSPFGGLSKEQFGTNAAVYHKIHYNSRAQICDVRASNVNDEWGGELGALINHYSTSWAHCGSGPDNNGNLLMSQTIINGVYFEDRYSYDSLNRLTAVSEYQNGATLTGTQEYEYDRWGNRTIKPTSTLGTNKQFTVNPANNRLGVPTGQSGTMTYDNAGNLITDTYTGAGSREYDGENRMTRAWGGNNQWQDYTYDAYGQRTRRTINGVETRQVYGMDGEVLAEYAAGAAVSNPQKEYGYRNGELLVTADSIDTVWSEDAVPTGAAVAGDAESWNWVSSNPGSFSGGAAHQSNIVAGLHQHYFYGATATLSVDAGDKLVAYVYLDPSNMPSQIMLQWAEGGSWEHRAYWGANNLPWGVDGTNSRRYMGPLPAAGSWVRLEVPASLVGLEGYTLHGMAFSMWGGRATWDRAGKTSSAGVGSAIRWLVSDHLGTPRMIIDQTGALANVKRHDYLPFGEELFAPIGGRNISLGYAGSDGVRQQFTAKERDVETQLDYFLARYHSATQGRFTSVDPLVAAPQLSGAVIRPQAWNGYSYALNNPMKYLDPNGLRWAMRKLTNGGTEYGWFDTDEAYAAAIDSSSETYEGWTAVTFDETKPFTITTRSSMQEGVFGPDIYAEFAQLNPDGEVETSRVTFSFADLLVDLGTQKLFGKSWLEGKRSFETTITGLLDGLPTIPMAGGSFPQKPATPNNMGTSAFGQKVMQWGTGDAAARARIATLTKEELQRAGVTKEMAAQWRDFYVQVKNLTKANPSAEGRAELMQRAVDLLSK